MEVAVSSIVKQVILSSRAAAMTLRTVLLSLQALLAAAEPDDPQDAVVAKQYKENNEIFKKTARHWTYAYAGGHLNYLFILLFTSIFITFLQLFSDQNLSVWSLLEVFSFSYNHLLVLESRPMMGSKE